MTSDSGITLDLLVADLLSETEEIHAGLLGGGDLDAVTPAYERREVLFQDLQRRVEEGAVLTAASRTCIDRVQTLDSEILSLGNRQGEKIRGEQYGLHRRRTAIAAHTSREREEPRLITLKA